MERVTSAEVKTDGALHSLDRNLQYVVLKYKETLLHPECCHLYGNYSRLPAFPLRFNECNDVQFLL
jgi:hypothetical protein